MKQRVMNEDLWRTLSSINEWIRFSEGKAIALMAAQGVILGMLSQLGRDQILSSSEVVVGSIAIIFNAVSMFYAFLCLNPRLKLSGAVSPIYFGSIASSFDTPAEYQSFYNEAMQNNESIERELCAQIFINSKIANKKFKNVAYSIRSLSISLFFWVLILLLPMRCLG